MQDKLKEIGWFAPGIARDVLEKCLPDPDIGSEQMEAAKAEILRVYGRVIGEQQAENIAHTVLSRARSVAYSRAKAKSEYGAQEMVVEIEMIGGNCPVQAVGLIDGQPFYFRARGDGWSLSVGSDFEDQSSIGVHGLDVVGNPKWIHNEDWGDGPYDAGWMPVEIAKEMIEKGAALFCAQSK